MGFGAEDVARHPPAQARQRSTSLERDPDGEREVATRGRSKSRLRELTTGNRVSIVPEVPELSLVSYELAKERERGEEEDRWTFDLAQSMAPPQGSQIKAMNGKQSKDQATGTINNQSVRPHTPPRAAEVPLTPDATPKRGRQIVVIMNAASSSPDRSRRGSD